MDVSTLKHPQLAGSVSNLLFGLKVASESLSAVWDSVSFTDVRTSGGGKDVNGGELALNKLSLACTELAKCGDLSKGWQNRSLKQLGDELSGSERTIKYGSLETLSKQVQVHLDRLPPSSVAGLTERGLVPEGEATMSSALEGRAISAEDPLEKTPEERWVELREGLARVGNFRIDEALSQRLDPVQEAVWVISSFGLFTPGVNALDKPSLPQLQSWWIENIYTPMEPGLSLLSIPREDFLRANLPSAEGLTFLKSREGKAWSASLMTCLWELLDEKHFPGFYRAYQDAVATGNWMEVFRRSNELPVHLAKALADRNRAKATKMIDPSYEFQEEDFSLGLKLRAAVVFHEQCRGLQQFKQATQVLAEQRISTLADFSDDGVPTVESFAKTVIDKGIVRPGCAVKDVVPISQAIAEQILELTAGLKPDDDTSVGERTLNFVAKLKLLSDLQGILKDWPAELSDERERDPNWLAIFLTRVAVPLLKAMRTYNQQFYERGCEPLELVSGGMEEGMQLGAAIHADPHEWFKSYVAEMFVRLGLPLA